MPLEAVAQQVEVRDAIAASVSAIVVDLDTGILLGATPIADEMFGYIEGELTGKLVHQLVPVSFQGIHVDHFRKFSEHPNARQMGDTKMTLAGLRRDGTEFPVEIALRAKTVGGKRAVVATILDMSKRAIQP